MDVTTNQRAKSLVAQLDKYLLRYYNVPGAGPGTMYVFWGTWEQEELSQMFRSINGQCVCSALCGMASTLVSPVWLSLCPESADPTTFQCLHLHARRLLKRTRPGETEGRIQVISDWRRENGEFVFKAEFLFEKFWKWRGDL
jgi:hypothetical protein